MLLCVTFYVKLYLANLLGLTVELCWITKGLKSCTFSF